MNQLQQLEQDLRYVRGAVERADTSPAPRWICFLWATLGGIGFALVDLQVAWVPTYWKVVGPGGFLLSAYLGWRHARSTGQPCLLTGRRQMLHWGGMLAAICLLLLLPAFGAMPWAGTGPAILLLLALGYFQAGVHFDPACRWIGLLLAAGYVVVLFVAAYAWGNGRRAVRRGTRHRRASLLQT
jgi:hypothetical protein